MRTATPVKERIFQSVEMVTESGCWIWMKKIGARGYGHIQLNDKTRLAHRVSYEAFVGPIPDQLLVCHVCDVRCCVNPAHLFLGTQKDNIADARRKHGRHGSALRPPKHGEHRKLSDAERMEVVSLYVPYKVTQRELAMRYGVCENTILSILSDNRS